MNIESLKPIVEAILFASESPLNAGDLLKVINRVKSESATPEEVAAPQEAAAPENPPQEGEETSEKEEEEEGNPFRLGPIPSIEEQLARASQAQDEKLSRGDIQLVINELVEEYENNPDRGFILVNVAQGFQFRTRIELAPYLKAMNKVAPTRLSQASLETLAIVAYRQPLIRAEIDQIRGVDSGGVLKTLLDRGLIRIVGKKEEAGKPILYGTTENFLEIFNLRSLQDLPTLKDLAQIEEEMKKQSASEEDTVPLDDFEDPAEEVAESINFTARFEELEKEEEEALNELEDEMRELKDLEEKVVQTLTKDKADPEANPSVESAPEPGETPSA